jgi:hypothetical protein
MFGRALEALCRDHLESREIDESKKTKPIMLGAGIKQLKVRNIIDDRLYDWSQHLQAFRNLAAHPADDFEPTNENTNDLQAFAYVITEYVYRYNEFKARMEKREKAKAAKKSK